MTFNLNNPFSEKKILGPGETDPKADVELARTLLGDEAAEEYAEALAGSAAQETLSDDLTGEEKAAIEKHEKELATFEAKQKRLENIPGERIELTIGGKTKEALLAEMEMEGISVGTFALDMISKITLTESQEKLTLVKLFVSDLGFLESATTEEIFAKAKDLGLDLVPPETGIYLRLQCITQPEGEYLFMGMAPVSDSTGRSGIFRISNRAGGLYLDSLWAGPDFKWPADSESELVFRLRK